MLLICSSMSLWKCQIKNKSTVVTAVSSRSQHLACYTVMISILLSVLYKNCHISLTHISFQSSFCNVGHHLFFSIPWFKPGAYFHNTLNTADLLHFKSKLFSGWDLNASLQAWYKNIREHWLFFNLLWRLSYSHFTLNYFKMTIWMKTEQL